MMQKPPFELLRDFDLLSDCLQQVVRGGHGHSGTAHGASELNVWVRFGGSRLAPRHLKFCGLQQVQ